MSSMIGEKERAEKKMCDRKDHGYVIIPENKENRGKRKIF